MANIAEILSNYPIGTILYSPAFGVVKLKKIRPHLAVIVTDEHGEDWEVLYDGRFSLNGECMLFPSKAERDWDCFSEKRVFGGVVMKQYLSPEQMAKLIGLGFEKPKNERWVLDVVNESTPSIPNIVKRQDYSIGELIEILQKRVYQIEDSGIPCDLNIHYDGGTWLIVYICERDGRFKTERLDLIDALYDMVTLLKERGMI